MVESQSQANHASVSGGLTQGVFVGREIAELKAVLEDALLGRGRLVMLVGEPGIGKTRTARELSSYAVQRGAQVSWGRCYEDQGMPPYWPWIQVIRFCLRGREARQLRSEMGVGAANIAEVVPEVKERLPDLPPPLSLDPQESRFRLFDSIATFLARASKTQPLMLVLDNLHWADRSSLLLLEFLVQELPECRLLVVGTYRDTELAGRHPLSNTLGELARHPNFSRFVLRGLREEDVGSFIQSKAGFTPHKDLVEAVHAQTEGNPLFLTQVIELLLQEGELTSEGAVDGRELTVQIPPGVREVIGRRLNRLSERCNQVLTVASVIGREFGVDLLGRLMTEPGSASWQSFAYSLSSTDLVEPMEEALVARVIEEMPHTTNRFQFTHVLVQNTLAHKLSALRRAGLHLRIGEALEEQYEGTAEVHASVLAYHFAEASPVAGPEKLVRYSLLAGERALAVHAYEEALVLFQRGLTAKGVALTGTAPAGDAEAAELLFGLGQAQEGTQERLWSGPEIFACFHRAFDHYVGSGDVGRAVDIAAHHISSNIGGELIAKALELVPADSHDAGRLLSRYIMPLRADYERAQETFHRALFIARQQQDLDLEMITLVAGACVNFVQCHFQESLDQNLRAIELADRVDHPVSEAHARYDLMHVLYAMGDLEGAASHATAMLRPAERSGIRAWQTSAMEANENVSSAKGDWKAAREFTERGLAVDPRHTILLGSRVLLEYQVGDFDAGEAYLERLLESIQRTQSDPSTPVTMATPWYAVPAVVIPVVAYITGVATRFDVAEAIAHRAVSSPYVQLGVQNAARMGLALMANQRGDALAAGELCVALVSMRGTMFPQCPWGHALAADRVLGLLSQTMGNLEQAKIHFEDALAFCRRAGYRPELAWTCHDYSDMLLARNSPGDRQKASTLIDEGSAIANELGMKPLLGRLETLHEKLASLPRGKPEYPAGLTEREVEVLVLIAKGKTNSEMADDLVLSQRTVQRHISNIYAKINARNRAEATTFFLTQLNISP
jgi:DNA-binding CsgD family transcriptional regulator